MSASAFLRCSIILLGMFKIILFLPSNIQGEFMFQHYRLNTNVHILKYVQISQKKHFFF